jgi:hypothetical protein
MGSRGYLALVNDGGLACRGSITSCLWGFEVSSSRVIGGTRVRIDLVGALEIFIHFVAG